MSRVPCDFQSAREVQAAHGEAQRRTSVQVYGLREELQAHVGDEQSHADPHWCHVHLRTVRPDLEEQSFVENPRTTGAQARLSTPLRALWQGIHLEVRPRRSQDEAPGHQNVRLRRLRQRLPAKVTSGRAQAHNARDL